MALIGERKIGPPWRRQIALPHLVTKSSLPIYEKVAEETRGISVRVTDDQEFVPGKQAGPQSVMIEILRPERGGDQRIGDYWLNLTIERSKRVMGQ